MFVKKTTQNGTRLETVERKMPDFDRGTVSEVFRGRRVGNESETNDVDSIFVFVFRPDDGVDVVVVDDDDDVRRRRRRRFEEQETAFEYRSHVTVGRRCYDDGNEQ